jgi:ferredoxin
MVPSERTATVAIGHGKKAARRMDVWLRGTTYARPDRHELATYDRLNTWYYADAPATVRPQLEPDNAVIKLGNGQYEIDLDVCKGCGLCAAECPSGAITMFPERV